MDPFAYELLARPPPHGLDDPFSCRGAANTEVATEQLDDYFRAIGVLPPRPPAGVAPSLTTMLVALASDDDATARALKNSTMPYDADIDASLRAMEKDARERPSPDYLDTTRGSRMDPAARAYLVLWMLDFSEQHGLDAATVHGAVSYADRFLSARPLADVVSGHRLRLLGAAAVYAAAKFEDRETAKALDARKIACCCGLATNYQEVLDTERALVAALGYRLGGPTADTFVDHFTRHSQGRDEDLEVQLMAHRLADKSLLDHRCVKLLPSAVAAAAIFLARLALKPSRDPEQVQRLSRELEEVTGYTLVSLKDGVDVMYSVMSDDY